MSNFAIDMRDVRFVLYEQLGLETVAKLPKYAEAGHDREMYDMVLDEAFKLARDRLGPLNENSDTEGCHHEAGQVRMPRGFKEGYKAFCEGNWVGPSAPPEWGGTGLPNMIGIAASEMFTAACCSFMLTPGLTLGAANTILAAGTDEMKALYLEKMFSGKWAGTMNLTEECAGSAVGDLRTKAVKEGDHYLIQGTKIFISSGDHDLTENIIHLVLARTEGAPKGTGGLSLFVVPKFLVNPDGSLGALNDVVCPKIEEKMGIHGSATCVLDFGQNGPCIGYLLGKECEGMRLMFHMMNEARLYVGVQGMSLGGLAYQEALAYAKERIQGTDIREMKNVDAKRVAIIEHPDVRRMLLTMRAYSEAMRAMIYSAAMYTDYAESSPDEKERAKYQGLLDLLTPVCKAWCSDMAFRSADIGMQVFGGYGYIKEYPAEQIVRDVKIAAIYEGTNGIQALDLLGRKVASKGGLLFMQLLQTMNEWIAKNKGNEHLAGLVKAVDDAKNKLAEITFAFAGMGKKDPLYPVLNAVPYLYMFGDVLGAYFLTQQAVIADAKFEEMAAKAGATDAAAKRKLATENPEAQFYFNKVKTAELFVHRILPLALAQLAAMKSNDHSPLEAVF